MTRWPAIEASLTAILDRRWYTNHGPAAQALEADIAASTGVRHAIAITNPTIALMVLADALALSGPVAVSALAPPRCTQALDWAGLVPHFVDVDPETLGMQPETGCAAWLAATIADRERCPLGTIAFGAGRPGQADPVLIDMPGFGDDAGCAAILTDDDNLAARIRNIRSSYGAGRPVAVVRTANGRVSELQAAMASIALVGAELCAADRSDWAGRRAIRYGRQWLLLPHDAADRADLLARADGCLRPAVADPRAGHCRTAATLLATALVADTEA